jgi:phosphatidate cytidylyltransferase
MLILRIITALILIPLVILGVFYLPPLIFALALALVLGLAAFEMANFFWPKSLSKVITFLLLILLFFAVSMFIPLARQVALVVGGLWWLAAPYFLADYTRRERNRFNVWFYQVLLGVFVFVPCWAGFLTLREDFGAEYLLFAMVIIWVADSAAYFAGRAFGQHKLAPSISPKKTTEGLFGGLIAALFVAASVGLIWHLHPVGLMIWLLLSCIVVLWSVIGDLLESMLKRIANVKDSGTLLPGHGGFYDRIDSLTAAIPLFALGLLLLK